MKFECRLKKLERRNPGGDGYPDEIITTFIGHDWETGEIWDVGYHNLTTGESRTYEDHEIVGRAPEPNKGALHKSYWERRKV